MELLAGYDAWKTTPPEERAPYDGDGYDDCPVCGEQSSNGKGCSACGWSLERDGHPEEDEGAVIDAAMDAAEVA